MKIDNLIAKIYTIFNKNNPVEEKERNGSFTSRKGNEEFEDFFFSFVGRKAKKMIMCH